MKKQTIFFVSASLLLLGLLQCISCEKEANLPPVMVEDQAIPPHFDAHPNNPIFMANSDSNAWDAQIAFLPEVIKYENKYYLFYTSTADLLSVPLSIGLAISDDGQNWQRQGTTPLLSSDGEGFDAFAVAEARVLLDGDTWVMYFNARAVPGPGPGAFIARATANDITGPWVVDSEPVLTIGEEGDWDAGFISPSDIIKVDGQYYLFYSGGTGYVPAFGQQHRHQLGLATSDDGIHFEKYNDPSTKEPMLINSDPVLAVGTPGTYDSGMAWEASVLPTTFGFEMFYTSDPDTFTGERICYATSTDGIKWTKAANNPIFNDLQSWITFDLVVGTVLREDDLYTLYYSGLSGPFISDIGMAEGRKDE